MVKNKKKNKMKQNKKNTMNMKKKCKTGFTSIEMEVKKQKQERRLLHCGHIRQIQYER